MTYGQRLFGVLASGTFAQARTAVTSPDGIVNITSGDPISFVNGINNTSNSIDYTLYTIGTAAAPLPLPVFPPGWYWVEFA